MPGRTDESFRGRGVRVGLASVIEAVQEQFRPIASQYVGTTFPTLVSAPSGDFGEQGVLIPEDRWATMSDRDLLHLHVLTPYGTVALGSLDDPVFYCGSPENRTKMGELQDRLEQKGSVRHQWGVTWRVLLAMAVFLLLFAAGSLPLWSGSSVLLFNIVSAAAGLVAGVFAAYELLKGIPKIPPISHQLVLDVNR